MVTAWKAGAGSWGQCRVESGGEGNGIAEGRTGQGRKRPGRQGSREGGKQGYGSGQGRACKTGQDRTGQGRARRDSAYCRTRPMASWTARQSGWQSTADDREDNRALRKAQCKANRLTKTGCRAARHGTWRRAREGRLHVMARKNNREQGRATDDSRQTLCFCAVPCFFFNYLHKSVFFFWDAVVENPAGQRPS